MWTWGPRLLQSAIGDAGHGLNPIYWEDRKGKIPVEWQTVIYIDMDEGYVEQVWDEKERRGNQSGDVPSNQIEWEVICEIMKHD